MTLDASDRSALQNWQSLCLCFCLIVLPSCLGMELSGQLSGQEALQLDEPSFRQELAAIAQICERLKLTDAGKQTKYWLPTPRPDHQLLFLPLSEPAPVTPLLKQWHSRFSQARRGYASHLFQLALSQAPQDERRAYQLVWQTLREDPAHPEALKVLGTLSRTATALPRTSRSRQGVPELNWRAGEYTRIDTPHFTVLSQADVRRTRLLGLELEQFYVLWSQFFYELWAPPGLLSDRMQGENIPWPQHERMQVVLLKDRQQYINVLGVGEKNIGRSVGYYNPTAKMSIFYPAEELEDTFQHELTHQLLLEATHIDAQSSSGSVGGIWLLEGIALYMESLQKRDNHWSLGGFDASRMQTARYRGVRDGMWPDWKEFSSADSEGWKADPAIARLYSHAAGITHVLLDRVAQAETDVFRNLVGLYQGNNDSSELLSQLAEQEDKAKQEYQDWLIVDNAQLSALSAAGPAYLNLKDLVLTASDLAEEHWQRLAELRQLEWLDASFSNVSDDGLNWLGAQDVSAAPASRVLGNTLTRLSLEGTQITSKTIDRLSALPHLVELDLSSCSKIDDASLRSLENHPRLEILWLTDTSVSEGCLETLATLQALKECHVERTEINDEAWQAFLQEHPQLRD